MEVEKVSAGLSQRRHLAKQRGLPPIDKSIAPPNTQYNALVLVSACAFDIAFDSASKLCRGRLLFVSVLQYPASEWSCFHH